MAGAQYTPFFSQGMKDMRMSLNDRRDRRREAEQNELAKNAWMGDPTAMQELVAANPELAMQVEDQVNQRRTRDQQYDLNEQALETRRRDFALKNREVMEELQANIGSMPDYETAVQYANGEIAELKRILGDENVPLEGLTEEQYNAFRALNDIVTGSDWEKSGGPQLEVGADGRPIRVQTFVNPKTQESKTIPVSLGRAITGHDPEQAREIAAAKTEGKTAEERAQIAIDAGTAAAVTIPNINRALSLLSDTETAGWKEYANQIAQFVGYEGEETADLAELQQLLAAQMFDTLSNFRGAISNTELATAQRLSTGLGKNTEANKRILEAMQQRLARAVDIARGAAAERGDTIAMQMLEEFDPYMASSFDAPDNPKGGGNVTPTPAPPEALEYLKQNPASIDMFEQQFGYRPEGY